MVAQRLNLKKFPGASIEFERSRRAPGWSERTETDSSFRARQ